MNLEKVVFGFFVLLALTLNFSFVMGNIANPAHHHAWMLFLTLVVNLIATVLKLGDRTHLGAVLLATSLVADLQLVAAAVVWGIAIHVLNTGNTPATLTSVVSLSGGALLANLASVVMLLVETVSMRT